MVRQQLKTAVWIAAFVLFIVAAVLAYGALAKKAPPPGSAGNAPGEEVFPGEEKGGGEKIKAPDFTVFDAGGNAVKFSDLLGKPVVLNFWASWCPPCRAEMTLFNEIYLEKGEEITFMMIDLVDGRRETREKGLQYVKEEGFSFPLYFDLEQEAAAAYRLTSIPMTVFIDQEGYIAASVTGAVNRQTLLSGIDLTK